MCLLILLFAIMHTLRLWKSEQVPENNAVWVSCDSPTIAASWWRKIPVDMSARAVKDIDLLLWGLAHSIPMELGWRRWQSMACREANSPLQLEHLKPTSCGAVTFPATPPLRARPCGMLKRNTGITWTSEVVDTDSQQYCSTVPVHKTKSMWMFKMIGTSACVTNKELELALPTCYDLRVGNYTPDGTLLCFDQFWTNERTR